MGLDTTHNAFHGAYSSFNRFRAAVCLAIGGSYPPHKAIGLEPGMWYWGEGYNQEKNPGLYEFLCHSDCDGEIQPDKCILIADELEKLLPKLDAFPEFEWGHIDIGIVEVTKRFIAGCREAAEKNEPLVFH